MFSKSLQRWSWLGIVLWLNHKVFLIGVSGNVFALWFGDGVSSWERWINLNGLIDLSFIGAYHFGFQISWFILLHKWNEPLVIALIIWHLNASCFVRLIAGVSQLVRSATIGWSGQASTSRSLGRAGSWNDWWKFRFFFHDRAPAVELLLLICVFIPLSTCFSIKIWLLRSRKTLPIDLAISIADTLSLSEMNVLPNSSTWFLNIIILINIWSLLMFLISFIVNANGRDLLLSDGIVFIWLVLVSVL